MKSAYDVRVREKKRTNPNKERRGIPPMGSNPAQQVAFINARLDAAERELDEQRGGYWDCLMLTMLWYLHEELGFGVQRLEKAYKWLVNNRAQMRAAYRSWDPDEWGRKREDDAAPGQHVEDRGYREQLKACGFDYDEMESRAYWIDEEKGIIGWKEKGK